MSVALSSELLVLEDFLRGPNTIQTHLLGWRVSDLTTAIYDDFAADATAIMAGFADEAHYLETIMPSATLNVRTFQALFPDAFLSYVGNVITPDDLLTPYVRLMVAFKGEPRPWVVDPAWAWVPWRDPPAPVESDPYDVDVIPTDYHLDDALTLLDAVGDLFVVSATADELIAGLDELGSFVTEGADQSAAAIAELAALLAIFAHTDDCALAVDETTTTVDVRVASGDGLTIDSDNASRSVMAGIAGADELILDSLGVVKHEIAVDLTIADAVAVASGDAVSAIAVTLRTGDTPSPGTTDAPTLDGRVYTVNEQVIGVEETATGIDAVLARSDSPALLAAAAAILDVTPDASADDLTLAGDAVVTIEATLASSDALTLAGDDAALVDAILARADGVSLAVTEASTLDTVAILAGVDDLTLAGEDAATAIDAELGSGDDLTFDSDDAATLETFDE